MPRPKDIDTAEGRKRHEEKYQRILSASMEVFARKGFAESKISEIAQVAGVGDGTIYLYFKNKDDLLISVFEDRMDNINWRSLYTSLKIRIFLQKKLIQNIFCR